MQVKQARERASAWLPEGRDGEPWVNIANAEEIGTWDHEEMVAYNQKLRQATKLLFYSHVFDFIKDNEQEGDYFEFGCHRVRTFRMALTEARRRNLDRMRFYAFDSFQGLPVTTSDPKRRLWHQPGTLTTSLAQFKELIGEHGVYVDKVEPFPGFYSDSLTRELRDRFVREQRKVAFACVDCDLYESAVPVFEFLGPLLQEGSLIYLDDLFAGYGGSPHRGVARAFLEFQQRTELRFIRHMDVGWWGRCYVAYRPDPQVPDGVL